MATYRLWPSTNGPSAATSLTGSYIAGINIRVTNGAWLQGYWWWVCSTGGQPTGATKCALWQITANNVGVVVPGTVVTSGTLTAGQWNYIPLTTPIPLSPGIDYIAAIAVNGPFPLTNSYWNPGGGGAGQNGIVNGPLVAPTDYGSTPNGSYRKSNWSACQACYSTGGSDPSTTMPQQADASFNSWVDVQVTDTDPQILGATYRLFPTCKTGMGIENPGDGNPVGGDAVANFCLSTEIHVTGSNSVAVNHIWFFSNNGSVAGFPATTQLPTAVDIWSINSGGVTGTNVYHNASPSWSGAAGSGWISMNPSGLTLTPGAYKVSVYNGAATPVSWSMYRYGAWAPNTENVTGIPAAYPNGITYGPLYAPNNANGSTNYSYDTSITHTNTEPANGSFLIGPANANAGDNYPNLVVGVHSSAPGPTFEHFWIDMEVTVQTAAPVGPFRIFPSTSGPSATNTYTGNFLSAVCFQVTTGGCWFYGYYVWVAPTGQSTAPVKCALWNMGGFAGANGSTQWGAYVPGSAVTSGTLIAGQWNYVPVATPFQLACGASYNAEVGINGNFADTAGWWGANFPSGITNGPLYAFGTNTGQGGNTIYQGGHGEPNGSTPQGNFGTGGSDPQTTYAGAVSSTDNFWVDVQVNNQPPTGYVGSYRIWPNTPGGTDPMTNDDAAVAYVIATEFWLSSPCTLNRIWFYEPPGTNQILPTSADIWSINTSNPLTGASVVSNGSPVWTDFYGTTHTSPIPSWGGGWLYTAMPSTPLPAGKYKVSVYCANGASMAWGAKRLGYWGVESGQLGGSFGANGIVNGPITAPATPNAATCYSYQPTAGSPTEPGQSSFAYTGTNVYPNYYVGVNSTAGDLFQTYWVDVEVTPSTGVEVGQLNLAGTAGMTIAGTASPRGIVTEAATASMTVAGADITPVPPTELLAEYYKWTVNTGGTDAPAANTVETLVVQNSVGAPAAQTGISQFRIVDAADNNAPPEIMLVTNTSGNSWTVTRGAEGGAPWAHAAGWIAIPVLTPNGLRNYVQGLIPH